MKNINKCNFYVESNTMLADEKINIKITSLPTNSEIKLRLTISDFYCINAPMNLDKKLKWCSEVVFLSDENGVISLDESPALYGDYTGVYPMGLFYKAKPSKLIKTKLSNDINDIPLYDKYNAKVEVFFKNSLLGEYKFNRYYKLPHINCEEVKGANFIVRLFVDPTHINVPAIIVLSGSEGRIEKAQNIAQLLSGYGFVTMAICYFGIENTSQNLERIPIDIIENVISILKNRVEVDENRIGIYGRSKGAEFALISASYFSDIKCIVVNSPSNIVMEGIKGWKNSKSSSWTYKGKEIIYTKFSFKNFLKEKVTKKKYKYDDSKSVIKVENINGSILVLSPYIDEIWSSYLSTLAITNRIKESNFKFNYKKYIYPNSGHMMTIAFQPNSRYKKAPWEQVMNEGADSWYKTIKFFQNEL
jgi:uncharacterized protein